MHCGKVASVTNYYSETIGLLQKILVFASILEMFPYSCKLKK